MKLVAKGFMVGEYLFQLFPRPSPPPRPAAGRPLVRLNCLLTKKKNLDYSPDPVYGEFFRAVVNSRTTKETIDALVGAIEDHLVILN